MASLMLGRFILIRPKCNKVLIVGPESCDACLGCHKLDLASQASPVVDVVVAGDVRREDRKRGRKELSPGKKVSDQFWFELGL